MRVTAFRAWAEDLAEARAFYEGVIGLTQLWDYGSAVGYDLGVTLVLEQDEADEEALAGRFVGVSIEVDDIAATYADWVANGVAFLGPPETMPWGGTMAHFQDPAGNVLTLLERPR